MMPYTRRRVAAGGVAVLVIVAVVAVIAWWCRDTPVWRLLPQVALLTAAVAATFVTLAITVTVVRRLTPYTLRAVRTGRSRCARRAARRRIAARRRSAAPVLTSTGAQLSQRSATGCGGVRRPQTSQRTARWLVAATAAAVLTVAVIAVLLNYSHGSDVARFNGEEGWRSTAYPLPADGLLVAASLVMLVRRLRLLRPGWLAQTAFVVGCVASAGTNVLDALHAGLSDHALIERVVWLTWPTLALLAAHEMLMQMLSHFAWIADVFDVQGEDPELVAAREARDAAEVRVAQVEQAQCEIIRRAEEALAEMRRQAIEETTQTRHAAEQEIAAAWGTQAHERERFEAKIAHLQEVVRTTRIAEGEARASAEQLAAEVAQLEAEQHLDDERSIEDWREVRGIYHGWVAERAAAGRPVSQAEAARVLQVSPAWCRKHPAAVGEHTLLSVVGR
jgi:Protein of unknown function (DUF2637)